jgi:catechol 2,3-dioxygenase-like lactoylglutathione lyase family enzyme
MRSPHLAPTPEHVDDLATACVRFVERALGLTLDYAPETLPLVDHWLRTGDASTSPELLELAAPAAGAYFGEVIRRALGDARWHAPPGEPRLWRLEYEHVFLAFNPIALAMEAATSAPSDGWTADFQLLPGDRATIEDALSRTTGDVREEDFYRLAVRYDVVEQIVETLRALAAARLELDRYFGPDSYVATDAPAPPTLH